MLSSYKNHFLYVGFISMRKFKEVGAIDGLQFCGLATLKLPTNTCGNFKRLNVIYMNATDIAGDKSFDFQLQKG